MCERKVDALMTQQAHGCKVAAWWGSEEMSAAGLRRAALWLPACLGLGIAVYFGLEEEPGLHWMLLPLPWGLALASGVARHAGLPVLALNWAGLAVSLGFFAALAHATFGGAQFLEHQTTRTAEGRIFSVSRSADGAPRVLLEDVIIHGLRREKTPARIRVVLKPRDSAPAPGAWIRIHAFLSPPGGPVEPGGHDFRRQAFFSGLGATGFAHGVAVPTREPVSPSFQQRIRLKLARNRHRLSEAIRLHLPGAEGGFAAAIVVGDRAHIDQPDAEALRAANLAHLLAISGLHMGMLSGLVFGCLRLFLAAMGPLLMHVSSKKIAAIGALCIAFAYLLISGAAVATQRAFIMVAVALIAVLFDRPAITLRALAVAAGIILLIRPVSLMEPGFQMSFAATYALVAGYEAVRVFLRRGREDGRRRKKTLPHRLLRAAGVYLGGLVVTAILAGLATAPFAAHHFNRAAPYGLPANLVAVPIMGLVVAPGALLAGILAPFGLAAPALGIVGEGISAILGVAHRIANLPGAVTYVPAFSAFILTVLTLGVLWLGIWRGPRRLVGLAGVALAGFLYVASEPRPDVLVAPDGRLVGVLGPEGRALDHPRARRFVAETWLRRDGDPASQGRAAVRPGLWKEEDAVITDLANGWRIVVLRRNRTADRHCAARSFLLIFHGDAPKGPCRTLGPSSLIRMGGLALDGDGDDVAITPIRTRARRPWSPGVNRCESNPPSCPEF